MTAPSKREWNAEIVEQGMALSDLVFALVRAECESKALGADIGLYALAHTMGAMCAGAEFSGSVVSGEATLRMYAKLAEAGFGRMLEAARANAARPGAGGLH